MGRLPVTRIFLRVVCGLLVSICGVIIAPPASLAGTEPSSSFWIDFREGGEEPGYPDVEVVETGSTGIELKAAFPGAWAEIMSTEQGEFTSFQPDPYGYPTETGLPALPVLRELITIPYIAGTRLVITSAVYNEIVLSDLELPPPMPLQPSQSKSKDLMDSVGFEIDWEYYTSGSLYPASPVESGETFVMRGNVMQTVAFFPVAYDPASGVLRVYNELSVRMEFEEDGQEKAAESLQADFVLEEKEDAAEVEGIGYLIITADEFYDAMQPFVDLKVSQGYVVTMTMVSTITTTFDTGPIKEYIQDAYDNWVTKPSFLLLVGDTDKIPTFQALVDLNIENSTDLYYVTMDGADDWHPDIGRGRFPVHSVDEVNWLVNKYIAYENLQGTEDWLRKAAFIASSDTVNEHFLIAERAHNFVIDAFTNSRAYSGIFPFNPQPGGDKIYLQSFGGRTINVINAVNDGRSLLVYSGHGYETGWYESGFINNILIKYISILSDDIVSLSNENMTPFVASFACLTGNYSIDNSFGEAWVLQDKKGAIAFWGASDYTYWLEDEVLEKAAFRPYFTSPIGSITLSEMTDFALLEVEAFNPARAQYYWEIYNILGDPALVIQGSPIRPRVYLPVISK